MTSPRIVRGEQSIDIGERGASMNVLNLVPKRWIESNGGLTAAVGPGSVFWWSRRGSNSGFPDAVKMRGEIAGHAHIGEGYAAFLAWIIHDDPQTRAASLATR
jgi:hypothetical protein